MSAENSLLEAYEEWHRLTEAEGKAIRMRDWNFLLDCQRVIQKLQPVITQLNREVREEWRQTGVDLAAKEKKLRTVISELIEMGRKNKLLIQEAREVAKAERDQLEQASLNLKRLQQSYVAARPAAWVSFS
jgi:hypothetical protein